MAAIPPEFVSWIFESKKFDAKWYSSHYPDVHLLDMDPEYHFRQYGSAMGRAPNAEIADDPHFFVAKGLAAPRKGYALKTANELVETVGHDVAIRYAKMHVPTELGYTIDTLRANRSLANGREGEWLRYINSYIHNFGAAPIALNEQESLLDRLHCGELEPVLGGPLISVIMPAWNAETTIKAAAESILNQTWKNLELLIVDDFSTDGTWAEMQRIAARDSRVKIFRNKTNVGPYVSKNLALSMAEGVWITGHDADDWSHPQRLEHHLGAVASNPLNPRVSVGGMLRVLPSGMIDRFAPVSHFSFDGIARDAPISCLLDTKFLREELGGWDCVKFGADSELLGRAVSIVGDEFTRQPLISMICFSFEDSLTNHPTLGVDRQTGPSQVRRTYSDAWRKWHKQLGQGRHPQKKLAFPPVSDAARPFEAPQEVQVPSYKVKRNYAAITGNDPVCREPVTAICCSNRPAFLRHISAQMKSQNYENLHIIYVAHGPGHDLELIEKSFTGLASVQVLALPDPKATLGEALNLALDNCRSDMVTKIDDDDFYGPEYIRSSVSALHYNGFDEVGIVGRTKAYCYVQDRDLLALRFSHKAQDRLQDRVFGGTIFWSRKAVNDQRFQPLPRAVDTAFFKDAAEKDVRLFGCEPYDYIHVRYSEIESHTWKISSDEFLRPTVPVSEGLRLDLAFSKQTPPQSAPLPPATLEQTK